MWALAVCRRRKRGPAPFEPWPTGSPRPPIRTRPWKNKEVAGRAVINGPAITGRRTKRRRFQKRKAAALGLRGRRACAEKSTGAHRGHECSGRNAGSCEPSRPGFATMGGEFGVQQGKHGESPKLHGQPMLNAHPEEPRGACANRPLDDCRPVCPVQQKVCGPG